MYIATMASTSHSLSAWANTCAKRPLNPKTGLVATLQDQNTSASNNVVNEVNMSNSSCADDSKWTTANTVEEKLHAFTGDEFYEKLQQLKDENKKTLGLYQKLYQEKLLLDGMGLNQSWEFQPDKSGVDRDIPLGTDSLVINGVGKHPLREETELTVKKPPPGKSRSSPAGILIHSKALPHRSSQFNMECRPSSAPLERSGSLDQNGWSTIFSDPREFQYDGDFVIPMENSVIEYERAMSKVDKLWKDFKISDYTQRRLSFTTPQNKSKHGDTNSQTSEWRHRITIPKPFNMSIREALKEKKKTQAQAELEHRHLEKQKEEEAECAKIFKAQPVPAHVYLPMYEEIMERNETRRKYVKQYCQELLQSQVKPFKFDKREQEKILQRTQSAPIKMPEKPKNTFKAKPPPKAIFSPEINEKLLAEEELRKIRIKMRSNELLHEASLPPNMAAREKLKKQEAKEKAKLAKKATKKRRPRSAYPIPNYDALYHEFQKELAKRRTIKDRTFVEPFELETERIRSNREKIRLDIEEDERTLKENRWPFLSSRMTPRSSLNYLGALSNSLDSIPAQSTRAADLRTTMVRKERDRLERRQQEQGEAERRRRTREEKLRRYLSERTDSDEIPRPRDSIAARLKKIRKEDRQRQEAYQREIEEMKMRVEESPLLVEKMKAENAKKLAEKKFTEIVRQAGLDESEFINGKSSRPPASVRSNATHSGDNEELSDELSEEHTNEPSGSNDLTYTKSGSDED